MGLTSRRKPKSTEVPLISTLDGEWFGHHEINGFLMGTCRYEYRYHPYDWPARGDGWDGDGRGNGMPDNMEEEGWHYGRDYTPASEYLLPKYDQERSSKWKPILL